MKAKRIYALLTGVAAVGITIGLVETRDRPAKSDSPRPDATLSVKLPEPVMPESVRIHRPTPPSASPSVLSPASAEAPASTTNKLERLMQIRERFQVLAAGAPATALSAAKQISDEIERETALVTLVTAWTHGELSPPRQRARAIDFYGLEAGLGIELAKNPDLAVLWASELTDGSGRLAVLQQTATALLTSDPTAAFALSEQLPEGERRKFTDSIFAGWASTDTEAAIQWSDQLPDPAEREAALQAIRSAAPVGIGAALNMQDGYPVINQLLPGTPAELGGQLARGDRILAVAQGGKGFVATQGLALQDIVQMIRGAPGTELQLQILAGDAPLNSSPKTISIVRDQIKFKR